MASGKEYAHGQKVIDNADGCYIILCKNVYLLILESHERLWIIRLDL